MRGARRTVPARLVSRAGRARFWALAVLLAAVAVPVVPLRPATGAPVSTGSWVPTATQPSRMVVSAVRLSNGKVLAAQYGQGCVWVCFETYDPALDVWSPVVPLVDRQNSRLENLFALAEPGHAVAMLWSDGNERTSWHRLHGDRWVQLPQGKTAGQTNNVRNRGLTATLLNPPECDQNPRPAAFARYPCGQVLIAGGSNALGNGLEDSEDESPPHSADLYSYQADKPDDPGKLTATGSIPRTRQGHLEAAAALLADGRVLVASGQADIYDPRTGKWSPAADMPPGPQGFAWNVVRLQDGRVLLSGDRDVPPHLFDPNGDDGEPGTIGSWRTIDQCDATNAEGNPTGCGNPVVLADGTVLSVGEGPYGGGTIPRPPPPLKAWRLDPANLDRGWVEDKPPGVPAWTATLLTGTPAQCGSNCGNVLAAGGAGESFSGSVGASQLFQLLTVSEVSPRQGLACGGREVTVKGSGLNGVSSVRFGGVSVERDDFLAVDPKGTSIRLTAPRNVAGTVPVTVTTAGGATWAPTDRTTEEDLDKVTFTYTRPPPATIASLSPAEGKAAGGTSVKVAGTFPAECVRSVHFGDTKVDYAPDPASPASRITTTSPAGNPGTVRVQVGVDPGLPEPEGTVLPSEPETAGADQFSYLALPSLGSVTPPRAPATGGVSVTIAGQGLQGASEVRFGEAVVPGGEVTVNADGTAAKLTAPPHAPGQVPLSVTTPRRGTSPPAPFTYHPGISGIFPPTGPVVGGTEVTIAGKGLSGAREVRFGGQSVAPTSVTDTEIQVRAPAHTAPEPVPVQVIASGLTSLPEDVMFTYGLFAAGTGEGGGTGTGNVPHNSSPLNAAPPGGTGSPAPAPSPAPLPPPGASPAPLGSAAPSPAPLPAPTPLPSPGQAASPDAGPAAAAFVPAPVAGAAPAPAQAAPSQGPGTTSSQGAATDEESRPQPSPRHAMVEAQLSLGLAGAASAACFSFVAVARRTPSGRHRRTAAGRARPKPAH